MSVRFTDNAIEVSQELLSSSREILESFARLTSAETKKNIIRGTKTGETYNVPGTSVSYVASSPGEAPANRTGNLASSYTSKVVSDEMSIVYSNAKYARIEFGFGNIAPRPALRPASDKVMLNKRQIINAAVRNLR